MFLEILTRHYERRPTLLARCMASVDQLTDDDWVQTFLIDPDGRGVAWANNQLAEYAPQLEGDYIWVLDDDDVCRCPELVTELKKIVSEYDPDVIMLRADGLHGVIPNDDLWGQVPIFGGIGISCFVLKRAIYQQHARSFSVPVGADFQMICDIFNAGHSIHWHDRIVATFDRQSFGEPE